MEVQKIRRVVTGLQDREIFLAQVRVPGLSRVQGKEKRKVRIVGVEQIQGAQVKGVVSGNGGEEGVEQIVALVVEFGVVHAEDLVELRRGAVHGAQVEIVEDHGERKLAEVLAIKF